MEYTLVLELSVKIYKCFFNLLPLLATFNNVPLTVCLFHLLSEMNAPITPTI